LLCSERKSRSVRGGVLAQTRDADTAGGELVSVTDKPALEGRAVGLEMELESQHVRPSCERLVLAERRGGEWRQFGRRRDHVPVPVQDGDSRARRS